jgi:hypothetical protein
LVIIDRLQDDGTTYRDLGEDFLDRLETDQLT